MENKHFYWLKALRQKYSYKEIITALKAINCQLKEKSLQCEFKRIENYCKRKIKKTYDYQNCCVPQEKCTHFLCWQHIRRKI
ncbi:hypothetical protein [Spiroplasma endosymbiont of Clivina fossor]|uniref:hypothetical protein n=1 Tax=Spiroplasma endosymbiont of Clivina fossor TaxID=3066282 RepID=UPI00313EC8FC